VSCFWDGGFDVRLGDAVNGFAAQDQVRTWPEVEPWLRAAALKCYPGSDFAKEELGQAWKPSELLELDLEPRHGS
jgi:hypothetical protein